MNEAQLEQQHIQMFCDSGINLNEATEMAREMLAAAKKELETSGTPLHELQDVDDAFLRAETEPKMSQWIDNKAEGVRKEDIRWWHSFTALERTMIAKVDENNRLAMFIALRRQGLNAEQSAEKVRKSHCFYGDPLSEQGGDRPIPYELKHRIVSYIERQYVDPEGYKTRILNSSSFNALVRAEMKKGNL